MKYKKYQKIKEGDFVAITNVGAYGSSLSSNYNTKPFIAEILVSKNNFKIIRKKQAYIKINKLLMQFIKFLVFNILFSTIILVFILAIPTLILPSKFTLYCGKFLAYYIILILKLVLNTRVIFHGLENLKKVEKSINAASHQSMFETFVLQAP